MVTGSKERADVERRRSEEGYNLVVLVVAITLLHIALAASMPLWSTAIKREREAEAIFRGLQYAEAIRVFQQRFGRYPTSQAELLEVKPRSIRQLWTDPLSEDGATGFGSLVPAGTTDASGRRGGPNADRRRDLGELSRSIREVGGRGESAADVVSAPAQGRGQQALEKVPPGTAEEPNRGRRSGRRRGAATTAIRGVFVSTEGDAVRLFQGAEKYTDWVFTDSLITLPTITNPEGPLPSANSDRIGRPLEVSRAGSTSPFGDPLAEEGDPGSQRRRPQRRQRRGGQRGAERDGQ